ncbi:MAG: dihydroneopterin aldolase [Chlorobi bacterium]|nr:dihydroneopterin aldolase [Chlorobiota bacterium]
MGLIQIEKMEFYAYHGHFKEERIVGNRFLLDISIKTDTLKAAESDSIDDALNYQAVYKIIKGEMQKKSHLLENIGKRILDKLYKNFEGIEEITLKVSKMHPPMGGQIESVSVTMVR